MRLITRYTLYRAFPELDRFSDTQCIRFVRTANRSLWVTMLRRIMLTAAGLATTAIVGGGFWLIYAALQMRPARFVGGVGFYLYYLVPLVLAAATGFVAAMLVRDRWLLSRVRRVIRERALCLQCRYLLLGLPLTDDGKIVCPECGYSTEVDPSLGELTDPSIPRKKTNRGAGMVEQSSPPTRAPRSRFRLIVRTATIAACLLFSLGALWFGWFALSMASAKPGTSVNYSAKMRAHVGQYAPDAARDDSPEGYATLVRVCDEFDALLLRVEKADAASPEALQSRGDATRSADTRIDFNVVVCPWLLTPDLNAASNLRRARLAIDAMTGDPLLKTLDEAARAKGFVRSWQTRPLINTMLFDLSSLRQLTRASRNRMVDRAAAGDWDQAARSCEHVMCVGRLVSHDGVVISRLTGTAIYAVGLRWTRDVVSTHHPDEATIGRLDRIIDEQTRRPGLDYTFNGERLWALDAIQSIHTDDGWLIVSNAGDAIVEPRLGFASNGASWQNFLSLAFPKRARVEAAANGMYDQLIASCTQPKDLRAATLRSTDQQVRTLGNGYKVIDMLAPAFGTVWQSEDQINMDITGTRVMLAIERHRASTGNYPASLAEVEPMLDQRLTTDPLSGRPWGYQRLETPDRFGRGYLLYSLGADGQDNHAKIDDKQPLIALQERGAGFDFVINTTEAEQRERDERTIR